VPDVAVNGVARALNFLSAAQLYLCDNVTLARPLTPANVKVAPSGHWGVCPPVNLMLAHLGPIMAHAPGGGDLLVVHGGGHAGPAAFAHAYLTGRLGGAFPEFAQSADGMRALVGGFPHTARLGAEIIPLLPGQLYMGGQLGAALAFAHGAALDAPHRLVVPLIGDGECETGATTAAWLAARALIGTGQHGRVMPVILLNGQRMGAASLLSQLTPDQLVEHLSGLGYHPILANGRTTAVFRAALTEAIVGARPAQEGPSTVLICALPKGATGPEEIGGQPILGTARVHKTPLRDPRRDTTEFAALARWLASYRPAELFVDGRPSSLIQAALPVHKPVGAVTVEQPRDCVQASAAIARNAPVGDLGALVSDLLGARLADGSLRVFSPDELASNRITVAGDGVVEILNEEICHAWAQGYLETGRQALVIGYEAFAPIVLGLLLQHLKYRRLARSAGRASLPSIVYLLTSLGWNNTYTHQNPALASALLAAGDPTVRVHTPADAARAAASLAYALHTRDRCTIVVASKHPMPRHPLDTIAAEVRDGLAVWPHLSDPGEPDLVLAAAGDIAARELAAAAAALREQQHGSRIRFIALHDVTALGDPRAWPLGLSAERFAALFGANCPILLATTLAADAAQGLLWHRRDANRFHVVGYRDPGRPVSPAALLASCGMDTASLTAHAVQLLTATPVPAARR
jgi:xylulose-5-phosphate/fructose-6-phosphate phosphoketolase